MTNSRASRWTSGGPRGFGRNQSSGLGGHENLVMDVRIYGDGELG